MSISRPYSSKYTSILTIFAHNSPNSTAQTPSCTQVPPYPIDQTIAFPIYKTKPMLPSSCLLLSLATRQEPIANDPAITIYTPQRTGYVVQQAHLRRMNSASAMNLSRGMKNLFAHPIPVLLAPKDSPFHKPLFPTSLKQATAMWIAYDVQCSPYRLKILLSWKFFQALKILSFGCRKSLPCEPARSY